MYTSLHRSWTLFTFSVRPYLNNGSRQEDNYFLLVVMDNNSGLLQFYTSYNWTCF